MTGVILGQESHDAEVQVVERTEPEVVNEATAAIPVTAHQAQAVGLDHLQNHPAHRQLHVVNVSTHSDRRNG